MNLDDLSFNLKPSEKGIYDIPIYRYIPIKYLQDLLLDKILKVSQTTNWDDTYENFLSKVEYYMAGVRVSHGGFAYTFYGQCWTLEKESDALWRIYSNDKESVRIKTTVQKLVEAVLMGNELFPRTTRSIRVGQVEYKTIEEIEAWVKSHKDVNLLTHRDSLFVKRTEFSHEKEVRLIIQKNANREEDERGINHPFVDIEINPIEMIDEITFDPRMDESSFNRNRAILKRLGFTKRINQSDLYRFKTIKRSYP